MIAAIVCVVELSQAFWAGGHIGGHEGVLLVSRLAWLDGKRGVMPDWLLRSANPFDTRERWSLGNQRLQEVFHAGRISLYVDNDAGGIVPYGTV
jgi:hypothetical protein